MNKHLVVILCAGHDKDTPGKRSPDGKLREWYFNNPTAQKVEDKLKAGYDNVTVYHVHDKGGSDVPLAARTNQANSIYAKYRSAVHKGTHEVIYVSIHANAFGNGWNSADGIETFSWSGKSPKSDEAAQHVQKALIAATGRDDRGHKRANFHVLRETDFPAILVECGFMTNKEEAALLASPAYQDKCAQGIVNGLDSCYGLVKKQKPAPPKTDGTFYRVVTGSFDNRDNAEQRMKELKAKGFDSFLLPYKP